MVVGPLRNRSGAPNLRTRLVAALVIAGLVLLTAPVIVVPVVRFLTGLVL